MEDKNLDNILEDKLSNFEFPYQAHTWDALAEKLDAADQAVEQFDQKVREKLSESDMPYQPAYWDLMAQRLDKEASLRRQLVRYKITEALLVLLILVTFVHIFSNPLGRQKLLPISSTSPIEPTVTTTVFDLPISDVSTIEAETAQTIAISTANSETAVLPTPVAIPSNSGSDINNSSTVQATTETANVHQSVVPLISTDQQLPLLTLIKNELAKTGQNVPFTALPSDQAISLLTGHEAVPTIELLPQKVEKRLRLGMFMNANVDQIRTPYDEIFDLDPISQEVLGYGGGLLLGWEWKRWEFETGIAFNHKQYVPADNSAVRYSSATGNDNIVEDLRNIELNILQIPLQLRYDFVQKDNWHIYTLNGVTIHLAAQANYDVSKIDAMLLLVADDSREQQDLALSLAQQRKLDEEGSPSKPASDKLRSKRFSNGLFNRGNFADNSYYTITLGGGVERYLDERFSIFLQPTYRQNLPFLSQGLGPNEDRINTLELIIGAKVGF